MDISLTPELEQFIHQQVELGRFSTPDDAVNAAIQRYEAIEQLYQGRYESLRAEIQMGLDAGDQGEVLSEAEVFAPLGAKLQQKRAQAS